MEKNISFQNSVKHIFLSFFNHNQRELLSALSLITSALFLFGVWHIDQSSLTEELNSSEAVTNNLPTFEIFNFSSHFYDTKGREQYELKATSLLYFERQKYSLINKPLLTLFNSDTSLWHAESETGKIFQSQNNKNNKESFGNSKIELFNQVKMQQWENNQQTTQLKTEYLKYLTLENIIDTNLPVEIKKNGHFLTSNGLSADIKNGVYTLPSKAHIKYQPLTK